MDGWIAKHTIIAALTGLDSDQFPAVAKTMRDQSTGPVQTVNKRKRESVPRHFWCISHVPLRFQPRRVGEDRVEADAELTNSNLGITYLCRNKSRAGFNYKVEYSFVQFHRWIYTYLLRTLVLYVQRCLQ